MFDWTKVSARRRRNEAAADRFPIPNTKFHNSTIFCNNVSIQIDMNIYDQKTFCQANTVFNITNSNNNNSNNIFSNYNQDEQEPKSAFVQNDHCCYASPGFKAMFHFH